MTTAQIENLQRTPNAEPHALRWTKSQFQQMAELGWFEDKRVELIDGEIIEMAAMNGPHFTATGLTAEAMRRIFGAGFIVADQSPVSLVGESQPQPDVAVIAGQWRDFKESLPAMAVLVIEISDTTLAHDQGAKLQLYARCGIAEYWIVNLNARQLEIYRQPDARTQRYNSVHILNESDSIAPLAASHAAIVVADLLP